MKNAILALRLSLGWLFVYAGVTKIMDTSWSASGYLTHATSFQGLFSWFALPANIGWVNFVNEWGLFLVGLSLVFGFLVRYFSIVGIGLMVLYYLAILKFPMVGEHSFIVDEHIIYIISFCILIASKAGMYKGLDGRKAK